MNTEKGAQEMGIEAPYRLVTFPAEKLAQKILGRPIMNTALLGAFGAVTKEFTLSALLRAVVKKFPGELGEKNARVVEESYKALVGGDS